MQQDLKISKDILLYGQIDHKSKIQTDIRAQKPIIKIIAGDPGKGSIALSAGYRVGEGDEIQLYYEDPNAKAEAATRGKVKRGSVTVQFRNSGVDLGDTYESAASSGADVSSSSECAELFGGTSCSGIILGTADQTWVDESLDSEICIETK